MSSAAVQTSQQPSAPSAISPRQYRQSPHGRNVYHAPPPLPPTSSANNPAGSPQSTRRASRRPSNGDDAYVPVTPQMIQHHSPGGSDASNLATPRAQPLPPSTHASPVISSVVTTPTYSPAPAPPIPPPRTSSYHRGQTATAAEGTQLEPRTPGSRPSSSRAAQDSHGRRREVSNDRERSRDDPASQAAAAAQSRRKVQQSPRDDTHNQSNGTGRSSRAPAQSRSATAVGGSAARAGLPREDSTVINRLVVTDPQEDVARERMRQAEARPVPAGVDVSPMTGLGLIDDQEVDTGRSEARRPSRQEQQKPDKAKKETKFGEYILGQTLGEGEFGKVKMGWKKEGGVQVAIKLIRRETLGSNPSRLPKIYREISILQKLQHPNIVRLHEMVETERHIGIILEYASGGELFDYILKHRFLKDSAARRLFAQLVSGVGYLHKKGIVHRDLKLENLLLDRNRNIIITDFGFANTFDPSEELGEEIEYNLQNRDFVKKMNLEDVKEDGHRRGDLMQTSCGSPCYAAPELVVSDSLYTGRKVDVWSCGVILYAMLAGYLPFDDDPDNPEGDNINLLYKYIVSTPLTFPEYVTPHARDLLKRILVPDPRKRADLFEVARHSWLTEYAHVVGFITSSTTSPSDIANTTITSEDPFDAPQLARSASVREPAKTYAAVPAVGGLTPKHGHIDQAEQGDKAKGRDAKRRTVQVEYVAPQSQTTRGESSAAAGSPPEPAAPPQVSSARTRARGEKQGPIEIPSAQGYQSSPQPRVLPPQSSMQLPVRMGRDAPRSASDSTALGGISSVTSSQRPSTGGNIGTGSRLPSRGNSYGLPSAAVDQTNIQGRLSQPKGGKYIISNPIAIDDAAMGDLSTEALNAQRQQDMYQQSGKPGQGSRNSSQRGHKRSSTVGTIGDKLFGRTGSFFGGKSASEPTREKPQKSYPPTSMPSTFAPEDARRPSTDSRRTSFGFSRKNSDLPPREQRGSRRLSSLLVWGSKAPPSAPREPGPLAQTARAQRQAPPIQSAPQQASRPQRPVMAFGRGESRTTSQSTTASNAQALYDGQLDRTVRRESPARTTLAQQEYYAAKAYAEGLPPPGNPYANHPSADAGEPAVATYPSSRAEKQYHQGQSKQRQQDYAKTSNFDAYDPTNDRVGVLQKTRKFADAYGGETGQAHHAGSSGPARRVMDFFRKRGRARGGEER